MSDDETGYCRPPKNHQFSKGRSGNPKGRPRKTPSPAALDDAEIIRRLDAQVIRVGDRDLTWLEAELIKIKEQALAGKPKAMRLWEKLHSAAVRPSGGGVLHMPASFFETEKRDAK